MKGSQAPHSQAGAPGGAAAANATAGTTAAATTDARAAGAPADTKIRIRGLTKTFPTRAGSVTALKAIDIDIRRGEFVVIVGPSGCGKTTLLRILAGLETASTGQLTIHARDRQQGAARPLTAMVFQEESIFPWMTVRRNVAYGLENRGVPAAETAERVNTWVAKVGLSRFADAYPYQLSGGMKQRVSIARAFTTDPEVLLMDEPFSALDEQNKTILQQELLRIWEETHKTVVFITHSIDEAITLGDRILIMTASPGEIKDDVPVAFPRPRNVLEIRAHPRYGELQRHIWSQLHDEVQKARAREGQGA